MAPSWCNALPLIWLHPVICSGFLRSHWKLFCSSYFWFYIVCCVWCSDTCESCFYKSVIFIPAFCSHKVRLDCTFLTWKYSHLCVSCKCLAFSCKSSCSFLIWGYIAMDLCSFLFQVITVWGVFSVHWFGEVDVESFSNLLLVILTLWLCSVG